MMNNSKSPFHKIENYLRNQQILPFRKSTTLAKKYLKEIKGRTIDDIFIGWICERDSFFAYLYKWMKKEARDSKSTKFASKMAQSGFSIMLPEIEEWISQNDLPVLIIPVPSSHGVSERFAVELYKMLDKNSKNISKVKEVLNRSNSLVEMKRLSSWTKRKRAASHLFSIKEKTSLKEYAILLIDDIVTSGSSLRKCANLLKKCGAKKIAAVSLTTNLFDKFSYKTNTILKN